MVLDSSTESLKEYKIDSKALHFGGLTRENLISYLLAVQNLVNCLLVEKHNIMLPWYGTVFYLSHKTYLKQVLLNCSKIYLLVVSVQNLGPEVIEGVGVGLFTVFKMHLPSVL